VGEDLDLPDEVYGFGNWLLWLLATRATELVDRAFAAGPARPSRHYGMVDGHPVPTPSLVAWLLTAAEAGISIDQLPQRDRRLDERQKVLRTTVSRAVGGEPRLFKDGWLRQLAELCGLGQVELDLLARCRDDEGYPVDPASLRTSIAQSFRARSASGDGRLRATGPAASRSLPRDVASFTGRDIELRMLLQAVEDAKSSSAGVVAIHAIGGMAGIGKTAFAVHAAHLLADRFPGGQIFLPLHGHTPGQHPVDPADALASLLMTVGISAQQIPPSFEARMTLWRDHLANRQFLLVLDDAVGHDQVRPLLPGAGGSVVLVTSRRHLTALEDAYPISLDTLPPGQAARLLVRLTGRPGLDPDDPAVAEIAALCGYLPLAIGMAARQLAHHPAWAPADLAADLAAARNRLELMEAENLSVAATFDLSYQDLTSDQQSLFRRLGLHPGSDIDAYAAAALQGIDLLTARRHLAALYDHYLLAEPARGRYRLHDLIREHAHSLADADPPADQQAALSRLMDYYQHAGAIAEGRLSYQARASSVPGRPAAAVPALADWAQALAWVRAERPNLLGCLDHATRTGQHAQVVGLTAALAAALRQDGPWADAMTRLTTALQAARHLGDRPGQANALNNLGDVQRLMGDYSGAAQALEEALGIYRDIGDRHRIASALSNLGLVSYQIDDYTRATQMLRAALEICRDLGYQFGEAVALNRLGLVWRTTANYPGAAAALEEALGIYRDLGDQLGQANALTHLGDVRQRTGDYPGAVATMEEALGICRGLSYRRGQANALTCLGIVWKATGDYPASSEALEEALATYRDLGEPVGQAAVLGVLGDVRRRTRDFPGATEALAEALGIFHDIGDRGGEAEALNEMGALQLVRGNLEQASTCHRRALALARDVDSPWDEAKALAGMGRYALAADRTTEAAARLRQALEIFERIGAVEASEVTAELDALTEKDPQ
jgi:tetratricopeptide (TPR) repeat protein